MILTKNIVANISDVPREWVFEYYLNLKEKLHGQDIKMLSVFSSKDKVPSMFVYFDVEASAYKFKDFSSGNQGDHITLVMNLFNYPTRWRAVCRIIEDYEDYLSTHKVFEKVEYKQYDKYKVTDFQIRSWNNFDAGYWKNYSISSRLLAQYNIHPLEYFVMSKTENNLLSEIKFEKPYVYGYFRNDGDLYKIYMPKNLDKKFIKVQNYIQGMDQLEYDKKYLIIVSSLKDLLAFKVLGINNIEAIAPDSENSMIPRNIIEELKTKYNQILVLFDNDEPGMNSMIKYKERYNLNYINLNLEKDLSDSVKKYGVEIIRTELFNLIKNAL
jgi:5S rRNA maturation endonuclease (ribonuclease M5)